MCERRVECVLPHILLGECALPGSLIGPERDGPLPSAERFKDPSLPSGQLRAEGQGQGTYE